MAITTDPSDRDEGAAAGQALQPHAVAASDSIAAVSRRFLGDAPLEQWHPADCGEMDLHIDARGDWHHEGRLMTRQSLVNLFARVLWREQDDAGDRYFLKTPVEKIAIRVDDVPLLVTAIDAVADEQGQTWLWAQTRTGDRVRIDAAHPLSMRSFRGEARPYVRIRRNLDALLHRNVLFHLLQMGTLVDVDGQTRLRVRSGPQVFELGVSD